MTRFPKCLLRRPGSLLVMTIALMLGLANAHADEAPALSTLKPGWNAIDTKGVCSAGTPYKYFVRPVSASAKLLVFFNGGGACWFAQQCNPKAQPNTHLPFAHMKQNDPALHQGIFSLSREGNPFADYNMVFLPYCTGDVHVGSGQKTYSYKDQNGGDVNLTVHHTGHANSQAVLDWVYSAFSAPERIVVAGSSAGAIGASFYAGLIAEKYSQTPVTLIADSAGGYNSPNLPVTFKAWDTAAILPDWPAYAGKTNETLTFEDFYIASARHNANLTIAQYNTAHDETQVTFSHLIGDPKGSFSIAQRILKHYGEIEDAVDTFHTYLAGGAVHTILQQPIFYTYKVQGVRFADWVSRLIDGKPVGDISCVDEARGCAPSP